MRKGAVLSGSRPSMTYDIGTAGGPELGEQIATTWLEAQSAG
jgi:hypothetical protein